MTFMALQGSVELGLIYAFMALGIFVSFRILNVPDLTVDGSFTLGASCSAVLTLAGYPFLGLLIGIAAGALAGLVTAFLQTKMKIQPILSGILTMTALYSVNLRIMQKRGNVSLLNIPTVFEPMKKLVGDQLAKLVLPLLLMVILISLLVLFFKTQLGMSIRATGDNEDMVRSSSINADFTKAVGLAIGNAIVGFAGALIAQYQQFSDINMGIGMVVIAMASLIIGEVLFGSRTLLQHVVAVTLGSIVYRIIIAMVLRANISQSDLKLISSVIVALALSFPVVKNKVVLSKMRKAGERDAAVK
ncbi:ABC transporter permease subunit [Hydrogenoanaerobacterium sp.]|uniref:ABC transporter permease n=1 Tax=Hydrogenoanaerobacterium sp. TaxID=2953763 RepID=UPI0028988803|nr:ABC transporter permease [Hydrogenoanaerobacterium sp.]